MSSFSSRSSIRTARSRCPSAASCECGGAAARGEGCFTRTCASVRRPISARRRLRVTSILAYARQFDPRIVARGREGEALVASGLHVASAAMRRLIETRSALRPRWRRAAKPCRNSGSRPDSGICVGPIRCGKAMSSLSARRSYRNARPRSRVGTRRKQISRRQPARRGSVDFLEPRSGRPSVRAKAARFKNMTRILAGGRIS